MGCCWSPLAEVAAGNSLYFLLHQIVYLLALFSKFWAEKMSFNELILDPQSEDESSDTEIESEEEYMPEQHSASDSSDWNGRCSFAVCSIEQVWAVHSASVCKTVMSVVIYVIFFVYIYKISNKQSRSNISNPHILLSNQRTNIM